MKSTWRRGRSSAAAVVVLVALIPWAPASGSRASASQSLDLATADAGRWIVQLREPSLATRRQHFRDPASAPGRRLDPTSADGVAYLSHLLGRQHAFAAHLRALVPGVRVQRSYRIVLNALAVEMSAREAAAVRRLPQVLAVTPDIGFQRQMYATPAQIGAQALWSRAGGARRAGEGVKVAIIDSGIYATADARGRYTGNPCFSGDGYRAPAGYPKGDTRFTNAKVIAARVYVRPGDPAVDGDGTPVPGVEGHGHGSHVAGTVACNAGTVVNLAGARVTLSGVAPRAYLMNYRVFYTSRSPDDFQNGNAYVVELVAAIEDAVADGADVISNSWGSSYQNTFSWPDPMVRAAEAAVDAGVVMVFAQGNGGPHQATGNSPSNSPKVVAVGASTKAAAIAAGDVGVAGGPPALAKMPVGPALFGPSVSAVGPAPYTPAQAVAPTGSSRGCSLEGDASPYPPLALTGAIALIERGTCAFSEKVFNAQRAGAIAAIVYNSVAGGDSLQSMPAGDHAGEVTIPAWFMRRSSGLAMVEHRSANAGAQASFAAKLRPVPNVADVVAGFSSRGPTAEQTLKPDVVAPGVDVLSAGYGSGEFPADLRGFGAISGTSMATPHVAGAAALLVQAHPEWTPAQVKSALMSTAADSVFLDSARKERAGVLDRGAGRIDLAKAVDPGLTFDRPSLSAGNLPAGRSVAFRVTATDAAGVGGVWTLRPAASKGLSVRPDVSILAVPPGGAATFTVTLSTASSAATGVYEGSLAFLGRTALHIPVYARVVPAKPAKDVLLVDDDGSSADPTLLDVAGGYATALGEAGLSYDVVDVWNDGFPSLDELFGYRAVLLFTGNNASFDTSGFTPDDQDALAQWLDSGGRLLATGQNLAETTDSNGFASERIGRARLYHGYLGVLQADPDSFRRVQEFAPSPTADGVGLMKGILLDLSPGPGGGIPNQTSVEAMEPMFDNDTYQARKTVGALFSPRGGAPAGSKLGFSRSSEPSLEQPRREFDYRSIALGFGLEGERDAATRIAILSRAVAWLLDEVRVSIASVSGSASKTITARATSSAGAAIKRVRWDFGDGSRATTAGLKASHRYKPGTYTLRVEATDALGHSAVAVRRVVVT